MNKWLEWVFAYFKQEQCGTESRIHLQVLFLLFIFVLKILNLFRRLYGTPRYDSEQSECKEAERDVERGSS